MGVGNENAAICGVLIAVVVTIGCCGDGEAEVTSSAAAAGGTVCAEESDTGMIPAEFVCTREEAPEFRLPARLFSNTIVRCARCPDS